MMLRHQELLLTWRLICSSGKAEIKCWKKQQQQKKTPQRQSNQRQSNCVPRFAQHMQFFYNTK